MIASYKKYKFLFKIPGGTSRGILHEKYSWFLILKNNSNQSPFKIEIEDKLLCKRYAGLYIENVTVKESPEWLKNRKLSNSFNK